MAVVRVGEKWGFIDSAGKLAITPKFDYAFNFSDGLAAVGKHQMYGYIDQSEDGDSPVGMRFGVR
jgi:hypothetical protein